MRMVEFMERRRGEERRIEERIYIGWDLEV